MLSDHPASSTTHQAFASPQPAPVQQATSPPTKQSLKNWWKGFRPPARTQEPSVGKDSPTFLLLKAQKRSEDLGHALYTNFTSRLPRDLYPLFKENRMDGITSTVDGIPETGAALKTEAVSRIKSQPYAATFTGHAESPQGYISDSILYPSYSSVVSGKYTSMGNSQLSSNCETRQPKSTSGMRRRKRSSFTKNLSKDISAKQRSKIRTQNYRGIYAGKQSTGFSRSQQLLKFRHCYHLKFIVLKWVTRMKSKLTNEILESQPTGIFGVPLRQSIAYANVAISLVDAQGQSYIYGYVPIVVAKCGVYLKEKGEFWVLTCGSDLGLTNNPNSNQCGGNLQAQWLGKAHQRIENDL